MADGELLDAREAMSLLGINENDLQTLVARGDLRAFRSGGTMKFRRDDVGSLKTEKGTEPTIIIPASNSRKASGILPAVPGNPQSPGSSNITQAFGQENATGEIVLDEIELMPTDDASHTQQVTLHNQPMADIGGATMLESGVNSLGTGEMTVVEGSGASDNTGVATAVNITGSGRRVAAPAPAMTAAPAMSRVRAASVSGVSTSASRRSQAVYQVKTAGPVWTGFMVLTSAAFLLSASVCGVMMAKGSYDKVSGERVIPPFLNQNSHFPAYEWCYDKTPGSPKDKAPDSEYKGAKKK
jgi:hypothetical protein